MSLIIAARFEGWDQAGVAARRLTDAGFAKDALHTFYVNSAGAHDQFASGGDRPSDPDAAGADKGAWTGGVAFGVAGAIVGLLIGEVVGGNVYIMIIATGLGAYLGSLAGALRLAGRGKKKGERAAENSVPSHMGGSVPMSQADEPDHEHHAIRQAGVTLAVVVDAERRELAADILRQAGGIDVERAVGTWVNGKWADFDPVKAPELVDAVSSSGDTHPSSTPVGGVAVEGVRDVSLPGARSESLIGDSVPGAASAQPAIPIRAPGSEPAGGATSTRIDH